MWIPLADWAHESLGRLYYAGCAAAMMTKKLVLAGAVAAALLGGAAVVLDQMAPDSPPAAGVLPSSEASGLPSPSGTGTGGTPEAGGGTAPATTSAASEAAQRGAAASSGETAPPQRPVLEVLPPASAAPTGLPKPSTPAALIRMPLPGSGSSRGKVVDGFPVTVVTFPERTVLVSSSVSSSDRTLQVTAEGIVELSAAQVTGHFQQKLLALGFQAEAAPAVGGQQSIRLTRGKDTVTVATSTTGTGSTRFTLLGTLHA